MAFLQFKVVDFCSNQKPTYDFLLLLYSSSDEQSHFVTIHFTLGQKILQIGVESHLGSGQFHWKANWKPTKFESNVTFSSHKQDYSRRNYTVFQKKTPTNIIGYKLKNSRLILIIFDIKIYHII